MATTAKVILMNAQAVTGNFTSDTTAGAKSIDARVQNFAAFVKASAVGAGTSLALKIQHSPDGGTTWFDLVSFTALTAAGSEVKYHSQFATANCEVFATLRASGTFTGGTTTATLQVELLFDPGK